MKDIPDQPSLVWLLLDLKSRFRQFLRDSELELERQDEALAAVKRAAFELFEAIRAACDRGEIVVAISHRGGGRRHEFRSVDRMAPDGISVWYASEPDARYHLALCNLLAVEWIDIAVPGGSVLGN